MTLDTPCKSHVAGSKHVAILADFIMYADANSYTALQEIREMRRELSELRKELRTK